MLKFGKWEGRSKDVSRCNGHISQGILHGLMIPPQQDMSTACFRALWKSWHNKPCQWYSAALVNRPQGCSSLGKWVAHVLRLLK